MSWLLFVDEPGERQSEHPYGVLTGIAVEDRHVWPLARRLRDAQDRFFGHQLVDDAGRYVDGSAFLDTDVFKSAAQPIDDTTDPSNGAGQDLDAVRSASLARAKIAYCDHALALARKSEATAFAMLMPADVMTLKTEGRLRKDYGFLLERFYFFLKNQPTVSAGIIVLPQARRDGSCVQRDHIEDYFVKTTKGRLRAELILPNPVYADAALGILSHLAELVSYVASWSFRLPTMSEPRRAELGALTARCNSLRFSYRTENGKKDWSFKFIEDLRPAPLAGADGAHRPMHR